MLLLSSISLNWYWLHRIFWFAAKAKYDWLEIAMQEHNHDMWDEYYIQALSKEFNVPVLSLNVSWISMNSKKLEKVIAIAKTLKVQSITFSPPHFWSTDTDWYTKKLLIAKRDIHMSFCIQNVEPKFIFFIIPEYKNATLMEIKRTTWDTSLDISSIDTSSWIDLLKSYKILWASLKNIYLWDKQWQKKWIIPGKAWWWTSFLPLESFLMKLKTSWYNWFITLKVRSVELWVWNEEIVLQNLDYVKKYYKKHFLDFANS